MDSKWHVANGTVPRFQESSRHTWHLVHGRGKGWVGTGTWCYPREGEISAVPPPPSFFASPAQRNRPGFRRMGEARNWNRLTPTCWARPVEYGKTFNLPSFHQSSQHTPWVHLIGTASFPTHSSHLNGTYRSFSQHKSLTWMELVSLNAQ